MKKSVRLLSVILLVAMLMSMMSTGAFAMVNGAGSNGSIVIGGSGSSNGGSVVIGGTPRPSDDSRYAGVNPNEQASSTELETTNKKEYALKYAGKGMPGTIPMLRRKTALMGAVLISSSKIAS